MTALLRYRVALVAITSVAVMAVWSACGDPAGTGPSPILPPSVACPANVSLGDAPGAGEVVTFAAPVVTGGTPPVTTTCAPSSGSTFPLGTTTVSCTAKDAINRSAVCSFSVTLSPSHLGAMFFVAFGDSITAGENGIEPPPPGYSANANPNCRAATSAAARHVAQARPSYIDVPNAYPTQLLGLLDAQFAGEAFTMTNEGLPGETAEDGVGRLDPCVLKTDHPGVLLLLEGVNDLVGYNFAPTIADSETIVGYLQTDVSNAIENGVAFTFVSTILPVTDCTQVPVGSGCRIGPSVNVDASVANAAIDQTNAIIRVAIPGATIVDGNAAFKQADPSLASLIDGDGLHPTPAGYAVLAQAYFKAIVGRIPITALRRRGR